MSYIKQMISFFIFLSTLLSIPLTYGNSKDETLLHEIPTLYKGRFRPMDAAAKLWLEDYYNRQSIKSSQYNQFHVANSSALSLLWKIQFCGHQNWNDAPLFYIYSSDIKKLLDLPLDHNYFSFDQINSSIYENLNTNRNVISELITYYFLKAYYDSSNRSGAHQFELQQLSPNLWVALRANQLVVLKAPQNKPWNHLQENFVITDNADNLAPSYLKEHRHLTEELLNLIQKMNNFAQLDGPYATHEKEYLEAFKHLQQNNIDREKIEETLNQEFPLKERLQTAGFLLPILPGKHGQWYSPNALTLHEYDKEKNVLVPISNFTTYSDDQFKKIQHTYFKLIFEYSDPDLKNLLATMLTDNYKLLLNTPSKEAWEKNLYYPSLTKLKLEYWYYQIPLIETSIAIYSIAIILLALGIGQKKRRIKKIGNFFALIAFTLNGIILAMRCFILGRPPVSNMFETVIYVPWVAVLASLFLSKRLKNYSILLGSCLIATILLVLLKVTGLGSSMENVQAVLDSQFWLTIHVLMVVGSYGVFALAGILGQFYLWQYISHQHETYSMHELGYAILQSMYIGVALLIPGTILGGIWAAQSWGRFWDWDPKESWAFISSCLYIIFIHAYTFKHIRFFGLAMGAVLGLLAISFTWYGVNYILGTGLHSYGFGSGGEIYYYLFVIIEFIFLFWAAMIYLKSRRKPFERK